MTLERMAEDAGIGRNANSPSRHYSTATSNVVLANQPPLGLKVKLRG
jgi:hypothetical protein